MRVYQGLQENPRAAHTGLAAVQSKQSRSAESAELVREPNREHDKGPEGAGVLFVPHAQSVVSGYDPLHENYCEGDIGAYVYKSNDE